MRQAHVLYGGPSTSGAFDLDHEVYQGRLMPSAKASTLIAQEAGQTKAKRAKVMKITKIRFAFGRAVALFCLFSLL